MANEFIARNGFISLDNSQVTGSLSVTNGAKLQGTTTISGSLIVSGTNGAGVFSQGGTLSDYVVGISSKGAYMVWRAPFSCSIVGLFGYREGGGNAEVNALRTGSAGSVLHSSTNITLNSDAAWISAGTLQNKDYNIGDSLKIIISGSANNQVAVQVDFIRKN